MHIITYLFTEQGYVNNSSERPLLQSVFNNYLNKLARSVLTQDTFLGLEPKRKKLTATRSILFFPWTSGSEFDKTFLKLIRKKLLAIYCDSSDLQASLEVMYKLLKDYRCYLRGTRFFIWLKS